MRRDRLTFAMMIGVPMMQLVLFGYAINMDPKGLPTAVVSAESERLLRARFVRALENTGYFRVVAQPATRGRGRPAGGRTATCSSCSSCPRTSRAQLQRGERPLVLVEADATDPAATSNALAALQQVSHTALDHDLTGPLARAARRRRRPSRFACTGATTPRASRSTTSCPASWAWCSR